MPPVLRRFSPAFDTTVLRSYGNGRLPLETCPPPFPSRHLPLTTAHSPLTLRTAYPSRPSPLTA